MLIFLKTEVWQWNGMEDMPSERRNSWQLRFNNFNFSNTTLTSHYSPACLSMKKSRRRQKDCFLLDRWIDLSRLKSISVVFTNLVALNYIYQTEMILKWCRSVFCEISKWAILHLLLLNKDDNIIISTDRWKWKLRCVTTSRAQGLVKWQYRQKHSYSVSSKHIDTQYRYTNIPTNTNVPIF